MKLSIKSWIIWAGLLMAATGFAASQPGLLKSEFIFDTAPFPQCHASTIAESQSGLVAAWFGGTRERDPNVGIWMSRFIGNNWTPPVEIANGIVSVSPTNRFPCWNPVLCQHQPVAAGPLMLFYKVGPSPGTWWGMLTTSGDGGKTWLPPRRLPEGILGPTKNKPFQFGNGDILCPSSTEGTNGWQIHFERTGNLGGNWISTAPLNDGKEISAIQPSILLCPGNQLHALGRTKQGKIFEISSSDDGRSWDKITLTSLPNPNSGIDAVTLKDGRQLLVYNHTDVPKARSPLNVAVSRDCKEWQAALVLEDEPGSEFSYPAVIQTSDGLVHITYTWKRRRIKHVVIDPVKLEPRSLPGSVKPK